jgi:hypothetical protein
MLPLYLLKYREEVKRAVEKGGVREKAQKITELIENIFKGVNYAQQINEITVEEKRILLLLVLELNNYIYGKYDELKEEGVVEVAERAYKFSFEDVIDEFNELKELKRLKKESEKKEKKLKNVINLMEEKHKRELTEKARELAEKEKEKERELAEKEREKARELAEKEKEKARELAEKEREKAIENFAKAKEALIEGIPIEKVIKIFKLSEEEIEKLKLI